MICGRMIKRKKREGNKTGLKWGTRMIFEVIGRNFRDDKVILRDLRMRRTHNPPLQLFIVVIPGAVLGLLGWQFMVIYGNLRKNDSVVKVLSL